MIILRTITVVCFVLINSALALSDEAFDFFVETCRHSGYHPSEIATFQAELTSITRVTLLDGD